jgi:hypothetical protein
MVQQFGDMVGIINSWSEQDSEMVNRNGSFEKMMEDKILLVEISKKVETCPVMNR